MAANATYQRAQSIISAAEDDLGPLSDGQKRDLLADNTDWPMELIKDIVAGLYDPKAMRALGKTPKAIEFDCGSHG